MEKESNWKNTPGEKIRRQYFNVPIYGVLSLVNLAVSTVTAVAVSTAESTVSSWLEDVVVILLLSAVVLLPLGLLSLLNRFFFGEVICVLDDKGLHYDGGFIWWQDIKNAVYEPDTPDIHMTRRIFCLNQLSLTVKPFAKARVVELDHAPFFLLRKVKKHCPGIPCKISPWGITWILTLSLGVTILSVLGVLLV